MWKLKISNIVCLLLLIYTAEIPSVKYWYSLTFHNFSWYEENQIIEYLRQLDVRNRKSFVFTKEDLEDTTAGTAYRGFFRCFIELDPIALEPVFLKPIVYHEVGHCFGLEHSENPHDIMYYTGGSEDDYTKEDWERFISLLKSRF